jgi:REP element-mobilizing transposase RayT
LDDDDREFFLRRLQRIVSRTDAELYGFVLMPNHVHVVLRRHHEPVSRFMHALLAPNAQYFNHKHGTVGHLFQGRYRSVVCQDETYLVTLIRYVHRNPVRANLSSTPEYPWSSYAAYLQTNAESWIRVEPVLSFFDLDKQQAREAFRAFHEHKETPPEPHEAFEPGRKGVLGDEEFTVKAYQRAARTHERDWRMKKALLEVLHECLESNGGLVSAMEVRGPSRRKSAHKVRREFAAVAVEAYGYSYVEVAGFLRRSPANVRTMLWRHRSRR